MSPHTILFCYLFHFMILLGFKIMFQAMDNAFISVTVEMKTAEQKAELMQLVKNVTREYFTSSKKGLSQAKKKKQTLCFSHHREIFLVRTLEVFKFIDEIGTESRRNSGGSNDGSPKLPRADSFHIPENLKNGSWRKKRFSSFFSSSSSNLNNQLMQADKGEHYPYDTLKNERLRPVHLKARTLEVRKDNLSTFLFEVKITFFFG